MRPGLNGVTVLSSRLWREALPRRLRAFLYKAERALVGVVMTLLALVLERLVLRSSQRGR